MKSLQNSVKYCQKLFFDLSIACVCIVWHCRAFLRRERRKKARQRQTSVCTANVRALMLQNDNALCENNRLVYEIMSALVSAVKGKIVPRKFLS